MNNNRLSFKRGILFFLGTIVVVGIYFLGGKPIKAEEPEDLIYFGTNKDYNNKLDSSGLTSGPLSTFHSYIQLDVNGIPLTNAYLIPDNLIFANARISNSNVRLNGQLVTGDTDIYAGDKIIFENVVGDVNPGINAEYTVVSSAATGNASFPQVTRNGFRGRSGTASGHVGTLVMDVRYINSEGEILAEPIWTSYSGGTQSSVRDMVIQTPQDSLVFVAARGTTHPWSVSGSDYRFTASNANINIVTRGETRRVRIEIPQSTVIFFHGQQGEAIDVDYTRLSVSGQTNESTFSSQYLITQVIPGFTTNDLEILVNHPSILKEEEVEIFSITDDQGNDLTNMVNITKYEEQTIFTIYEAELENLRTNTVNIALEYKLEKSEALYEYLAGDYVDIPLEASNSRSSTVASDSAQTWVRPWGEAIPQEVAQDSSTEDSNAIDFVTDLQNKLVGDEPFVVGFAEEKTFDTLGNDSVDVIIESEISGIQNTITVPVTVIEADVVLTVEFVNEIYQVMPGYTVTLEGKIGDILDLTQETAVTDQLTQLTAAGFEIAARPEKETNLLLDKAEMTVQYKLQGVLSLSSAPAVLDFGTLTYNAMTQRAEGPVFEDPLVVTDTRAEAESGWQLTAKMDRPLENADGRKLVDALRYVFNGKETILDDNAQTIYTNQVGEAGVFNVSDSWGNTAGTDGLKLQINSENTVYTGDYVGVITWKIMAGQP